MNNTQQCYYCEQALPHGPAGCARTLQRWQRESPQWCAMMLREIAERLHGDATDDAAPRSLDRYRVGALVQRRLNLLAAANVIEQSLSKAPEQHGNCGVIQQNAARRKPVEAAREDVLNNAQGLLESNPSTQRAAWKQMVVALDALIAEATREDQS